MEKTILGLDFNNVLYSHFYGPALINSQGENVNAIKGFIFRLRNLREAFDPDYIVIAHDVSRARTFRKRMYPEYKAKRKPAPGNFPFQADAALRIMSLLGYPTISNEAYEADDILGMVSRLGEDLGMKSVLVSSDRDLYQLVSDKTSVWSFRAGELVDESYLMNHYRLTPEQWIDLKILQGDKSDNIAGVSGIGEKIALDLMQQFGSIAGIYRNIEKFPKNMQYHLNLCKDRIPFVRRLVTIVTDYKQLGITDKTIQRTEPFPDEIFALLDELEIPSLKNTIRYDLLPDKCQTESE